MNSNPKITVFCAVWHKDPNRINLLRNHQYCLDSQDSNIERVYVFDGGEVGPEWLKGKKISSNESLSIYEAWNLAIVNVRTPYVMNLNLDDRISPECCRLFIDALDQGADLVGGEWEICFTQRDTDAPLGKKIINMLPVSAEWPPKPYQPVRLGSGTGERGTRGPACAWRMNLHIQLPRYPYRFADGNLIKSIGDQIWWTLLLKSNKKLIRLPKFIGKYYSHPNEQAEFRYPGEPEVDKVNKIGINYL
jgi:glycosyltransferase involved in cell wall biosynthesis